jgi:hypothetical protein
MMNQEYQEHLRDAIAKQPTVKSHDGFKFTLSVLGSCIYITLPNGNYGGIIEGDRYKSLKLIWNEIREECR